MNLYCCSQDKPDTTTMKHNLTDLYRLHYVKVLDVHWDKNHVSNFLGALGRSGDWKLIMFHYLIQRV